LSRAAYCSILFFFSFSSLSCSFSFCFSGHLLGQAGLVEERRAGAAAVALAQAAREGPEAVGAGWPAGQAGQHQLVAGAQVLRRPEGVEAGEERVQPQVELARGPGDQEEGGEGGQAGHQPGEGRGEGARPDAVLGGELVVNIVVGQFDGELEPISENR
jgi:hypothetical protein